MRVGDSAQVRRTYSRDDIASFATLAGVAPATITAVPEPLLAALYSHLLGVKLPGPGANYLKQSLRFLRAAPLDHELTATVTITRLRPDKHLCDLATTITAADGTLVADGRALVLVRDVAAATDSVA